MTKIALITTTIHVPLVLHRYREHNPAVPFFIAGDRKTPHAAVRELCRVLGNAAYYSDIDQEKLGYQCSELIGWNRIMRRNIALLEALKAGAEIIVTVDDDNIPPPPEGQDRYFTVFQELLSNPFQGLMAETDCGWFNVGDCFSPRLYLRGFSYDQRHLGRPYRMRRVDDARVGVAVGLWKGDPDIDAVDRLAANPRVDELPQMLEQGICVGRNIFAPVNSQNTAFRRDLAPLFMVWSGVGRYDDIWAGYFAQRVLWEQGYHVHYGPPVVRQERNQHNIWTDLKDELLGMQYTPQLCKDLLALPLGGGDILRMMELMYEQLRHSSYLPEQVYQVGKAWCRDVERVL